MRKSHFEATSERIEKYLSEMDRAQKAREVAQFLGASTSHALGILQLMEVFGKIQMVKRGGRHYYLLKGVYDDEQISAMLPPEKVKPEPRRRSILRSPRRSDFPVRKSVLEEHLSEMRMRASTGEGPSALAMIGLDQIDVVEDDVVPAWELVLKRLDVDVEVEERRVETPKKIEPFATVGHLPKDARQLNRAQTKHLKEQLKGRDGYGRIERFNIAFADFSALKNGSYGTIFYFSMGTNPWELVHRVTVDDALSLNIEDPTKRRKGRRRSIYDPIIDRFLESGHSLVEIGVEGRNPGYVAFQLKRRIENRGLEIAASSTGGLVYLENRLRRHARRLEGEL